MITVTVTLISPGVGDITVAPTLAYYGRGALVQWLLTNSDGSALKLMFDTPDGTPFDTAVLDPGTTSVEKRILLSAAQQSYHYRVVATVGGKQYTIPGCPEIIVQ